MEQIQTIDGLLFAKMLRSGAARLREQVQTINELNVFPIPDGDTGSNMLLTAVGGVERAGSGEGSVSEVARRISDGMLLSARGNSGVILSQFFEGIADGLEGAETADASALVQAMQCGTAHAYQAVMEPTEGTMLTVMRCATEAAARNAGPTPEAMLHDFLGEARRTLEHTPELLPVLKKAGVVDSGGAGLICIVEGMQKVLCGTETEDALFAPKPSAEEALDINLFTEDSVLEYGYCTELLLRLQRCKTDLDAFEVAQLTDELKDIGNSVVVFRTGSIVKLHIHTMTPDRVLALGRQYGEFLKVKIENMSLQHNNTLQSAEKPAAQEVERKEYGIVAVASGEGIKNLFLESGADVIVDGGQSQNPSAEDFLEAFRRVNADTVFVLPNNGNIVLAAKQAAGMYQNADVRVIDSHTVGDGYAALSMFSADLGNAEQIEAELTSAMRGVVTAEISQAVRDTSEVRAGQYIGFVGKDILAVGDTRLQAACNMLDRLDASHYDICLLLRGSAADAAEATELERYISAQAPDAEVYTVDGMQEIYDYILILE